MDDDPDDLAAAFFAQQAAKEKAKATLPTEDWIRVIDVVKSRKSDDVDDASSGQPSKLAGGDSRGSIDPASWLATKMPAAPKCHTAVDGIGGIILDSSDNRCILGRNKSIGDAPFTV